MIALFRFVLNLTYRYGYEATDYRIHLEVRKPCHGILHMHEVENRPLTHPFECVYECNL